MASMAFWYVLDDRLSRASYPTRVKAQAALKKARAFYGTKDRGKVIEAASDAAALIRKAEGRPRIGNPTKPKKSTAKRFRIRSAQGVDLGTYGGKNAKAALDAMARDAGYMSQADAVRNGIAPFEGTVEEL